MRGEIRAASAEDAPAIAAWILEDQKLLAHLPVESQQEISDFSASLVATNCAAFVYMLEGQPVGVTSLLTARYRKLEHYGQLSLIVQHKSRCQGVGSALLAKSDQWARQHGFEQIDLELYDSPWALFFQKRGFKPYASQKRFIKTPTGYLARTLYRKELECQ